MLANRDLYDEIEAIQKGIDSDKKLSEFEKMQLKTQLLMLKLVHNIRTNTVAVMKHFQVDLVKSKRVLDEKEEEKAE